MGDRGQQWGDDKLMWGKRVCLTCVELQRQNEYLQSLVDRLMVQTWPRPDVTVPEKPAAELPEDVAERITFGEG